MDTVRRRLQAIRRELEAATEDEFSRLSSSAAATATRQPLPEALLRELGLQLKETKQNILPLKLKPLTKQQIRPEGSGQEIMLQGFNWESWRHSWYDTLDAQVDAIADAGFSVAAARLATAAARCAAIWMSHKSK